jgi:hypothetical protein
VKGRFRRKADIQRHNRCYPRDAKNLQRNSPSSCLSGIAYDLRQRIRQKKKSSLGPFLLQQKSWHHRHALGPVLVVIFAHQRTREKSALRRLNSIPTLGLLRASLR